MSDCLFSVQQPSQGLFWLTDSNQSGGQSVCHFLILSSHLLSHISPHIVTSLHYIDFINVKMFLKSLQTPLFHVI